MKKFIFYISSFLLCFLLFMFFVFHKADGRIDESYLRFTTPKQSCFVLGTSKAAEGVYPCILNDFFDKSFYNYSFNLASSSYGPYYMNSVQKKYENTEGSNIHILTVDFWSVASACLDPNDTTSFRENNSAIAGLSNVCEPVNVKYLLNYFKGNFYSVFTNNGSSSVNEYGRLEVYLSDDEAKVEQRTKFTIEGYQNSNYKISSLRVRSLIDLIKFLKSDGAVYLVRLPVHPNFMSLEQSLCSNLDSVIQGAIKLSDGYLDMTKNNLNYKYIDGVHLDAASGVEATREIALWIKEEHKRMLP